jgi:hypothetical protein
MEEDVLEYELGKHIDLTEEVRKEVREPKYKNNRVRRGKNKKEKEQPEEEEEVETVTILCSEYWELTQMKT